MIHSRRPATFAQAAKLRRSAATKEKELALCEYAFSVFSSMIISLMADHVPTTALQSCWSCIGVCVCVCVNGLCEIQMWSSITKI